MQCVASDHQELSDYSPDVSSSCFLGTPQSAVPFACPFDEKSIFLPVSLFACSYNFLSCNCQVPDSFNVITDRFGIQTNTTAVRQIPLRINPSEKNQWLTNIKT